MGAHRYWGLGSWARAGSGGVAIAEVEMRGSTGGADLCSGGTASGASTGGQVAANAFDNNNATQWYNGSAAGGLALLNYDFGTPVSIVEVWLRLPAAGAYSGTTNGPASCFVRYSDDGTNWSIGSSFAVQIGDSEEMTVGGISDSGPGKMVLDSATQIVVPFSPTWPTTPRTLDELAPLLVRRVDFGGTGRIVGTVAIKGTPNVLVRRRVRLYRESDGVLVGEQWSDPVTGAYSFVGFDPALTYTVIAYDGPRVFRAAIADGVAPEAMP